MNLNALKRFERLTHDNIENQHDVIPLQDVNSKYLQYLEYVNLIHDFVNRAIITRYPFKYCHVNLINDPNEFCDWEFYLESNGTLNFNKLLEIHDEIVEIIGDFCQENDCLNVFDKIVFVV